ncbi:glycosyltransferase family 4 protein, partial [Escherichia coli]
SKGIVHLINVVKRINNEGIKVSLEIAGKILSDEYVDSCKLKEILEAKIENCPYIKYHGPLNSEKKSALLNRSDVFVLPTFYRSEAQPISVLEAMYFGCVIVTTAHNYMPDFVTAKNGIIINPDDEDDLYEALLKINNMKSIFSDVAAYNACYVKKNFSPENYINKITSVIIED